MKKHFRHILAILIVVFCGLVGWWIGRDLEKTIVKQPPVKQVNARKTAPTPRGHVRPVARDEFRDGTTVEIFASRKQDQVILRFPSAESYTSFIFALGDSKVELVDQIDRLRAVRLG
ncbi:MAG: hypothetical protein EOP85_10220, partial [Verrucomicrobiaceae bacterium]